jgi:ATP-dependent helicase HrpA
MKGSPLDELRELLPNCLRQDRLRMEFGLSRLLQQVQQGHGGHDRVKHWLADARRSVEVRHRRHERLPQVTYPSNLPITAKKDDIVAAIRQHQVVVIAGETGSGKTTQIPKMCLEAGMGVEGKIGCTQPRRVAALSISRRIAEELRVHWGEEVGCKIRFADRSSPFTYVKLMTDGILLAETQGDRDLNEYDAIVIDEAHERSLNIDFLLGHMKLLLQRRPDLKLIITSATIDTEAFSKAFNNAPIIEVSGRTYPVEVRYAPYDAQAEESGEITYIDATVNAVENVLLESDRGDVLIFMPSERDIRETQDDLQGRYGSEAEVVPLFGRLTSGEQDRVFAPSARRKIIVATNIAETSLTIPGVRFVIDTGLARMSRYSPRSRTKRLPIEPISQSSAKQRAGRCGRVENGICVRLYAEEDLNARPKDTQPEIQRANLAEVILKMKAWRLGEMETFPFINPPQPQAVQAGYQLLQELGALNEDRQLTDLGRDLARLPVDPSIGRMILQSAHEGAIEEVLIVAAGLSVQDPRERPMDKQEAADQAHRQFLDPHSDFLTLLKIWHAYDAKLESFRTQNQMRKFCRAHFLSYTRMREWIDIHAQLEEALEAVQARRARRGAPGNRGGDGSSPQFSSMAHGTRGRAVPAPRPGAPVARAMLEDPVYAAVHRSVLAGLLGHIAQRTERNIYKASGNRQLMLWPGSSLFERNVPSGKGQNKPGGSTEKARQPAWIVAGEIVETTRLYGRTVASVSPEWIADLGEHICKRSYGEPFWDRRSGRVLSRERTTLFGLEVLERTIDYGRVNPEGATDLFIRAALIGEDIDGAHRFLEHNRKLREKIGVWRTHHRNHRLPQTEDALFDFYSRHLENVSSVHDLNRLIRERGKGAADFLNAAEADLTGGVPISWDEAAFPQQVKVAGESAAVDYAYAPGEEHDGVTVKLPFTLAQRVDASMLDWIVPGLRKDQIEFLLKSLPKALRVPLMPIAPKVLELAADLDPSAGLEGLRAIIKERYGVSIPPDAWKREQLPDHLRPRVAVTGKSQQVLAAGRDLPSLQQGLERHDTPLEHAAWGRAVQRWEKYDVRSWTFGDLPEQVEVTEAAGAMLCAFPGLETDGTTVHVKLFRKREDAVKASEQGFVRLVELALQKDLAWVQKDLRSLEKNRDLYADLTAAEELIAGAYLHLRRFLIRVPEPLLPLRAGGFHTAVEEAKKRLPGLVPRFLEQLTTILRLRQEIARHRGAVAATPMPAPQQKVITDFSQLTSLTARPAAPSPARLPFIREELENLVPKGFLERVPFEQLAHWLRYLKALQLRADRAWLNPIKDAEKAKQVKPYEEALRRARHRKDFSRQARQALEQFEQLLHEYRVSVFAQELGTAQPVSPKRLDAQWKTFEGVAGT